MNHRIVYLLLLFSVFLMGANSGDLSDWKTLKEQEQTLRTRIDTLRREQDILLFQKAMYTVDSKYLILDSAEKTGQLKYKNRVLKNFRFVPSRNFPGKTLKPGKLVLTKKAEGKRDRHALIFGNGFVIQWKRTSVPPQEASIPVISVTKKEMRSLFFALEQGALAYLVR